VTTDFAALAGKVIGNVSGVRACLFVSNDGLPLGAHPGADERRVLGIWARLSGVGNVARGFMAVDNEIWAFSAGEHFGVMVVAEAGARPGMVLDGIDQVLAWAEERRRVELAANLREGPTVATGTAGMNIGSRDQGRGLQPPRGPRSPLHRDRPAEADPEPEHVPDLVSVESTGAEPVDAAPHRVADLVMTGAPEEPEPPQIQVPDMPSETLQGAAAEAAAEAAMEVEPEAQPAGARVDIVALAREFSGLLSEAEE
jgi:hypothetical protein